MDHIITIEALERLVSQIDGNEQERRAKLVRIISAEARILAARNPASFRRRCIERRDKAGHYDYSYPPEQRLYDRSGPRLITVVDASEEDVPTSGGFYFSWRRVSTDLGLYVAADGSLWGCEETGTGRLGQFAAHPGDCDVECALDWQRLDEGDIPIDRLIEAESTLRAALKEAAVELGFRAA